MEKLTKKQISMKGLAIVGSAGDAKTLLFELLDEVKEGNFKNVEKTFKEVDEELAKAHKVQTDFIVQEAQGNFQDLTFIMVHAQDHLMSTMLVKDLVKQFISLYKKVYKKK